MSTTKQSTSTAGIVLGAVLVVLGIGAYVISDFASLTALIPSVFGALILLLGVVGRQTSRHRLTSYGIGLLALLAIFGSARGIPDVIALVTGGSVDSVVAAVSQGAMIVIGIALLAVVAKDVLSS